VRISAFTFALYGLNFKFSVMMRPQGQIDFADADIQHSIQMIRMGPCVAPIYQLLRDFAWEILFKENWWDCVYMCKCLTLPSSGALQLMKTCLE
jgi:hypothetical protein